MRAWLRLYNSWLPDFMFDNHVTDGADMQYDVTWDMARNPDIAEPARDWVNQAFVPELDRRMAADGHGVAPYGALRNVNGKREFFMEVFSPRYSHIYSAVQDRPCLLVETHSLKSTRTRAWADYDIMKDSIETILKDPEGLRKAVRAADAAMMARAGDRKAAPVYLAGKVDPATSRPIVYRSLKRGMHTSAISGSQAPTYLPEADNIQTVIHDHIITTAEAQRVRRHPYLSEPLARRVAADKPELMRQFEAALAADPAFAADPQARLRWWFEHSPYEPITRVIVSHRAGVAGTACLCMGLRRIRPAVAAQGEPNRLPRVGSPRPRGDRPGESTGHGLELASPSQIGRCCGGDQILRA